MPAVKRSSTPAKKSMTVHESANAAEITRSSKDSVSQQSANNNNKEYETIPSAIPYLLVGLPLVISYLDFYNYLAPISPFGSMFYLFVILPIIDIASGHDFSNPSSKIMFKLERAVSFRIVTWLFCVAYLVYMYWALFIAVPELHAQMAADKQSGNDNYNLFGIPARYHGLILGTGAVNAKNILNCHELIHKMNPFEHWLGNVFLIGASFVHYSNAHILGHHKDIGLMKDATTGYESDNAYVYVARNLVVYFINAFKLDWKKASLLVAMWAATVAFVIPRASYPLFFSASLIGTSFLLLADYLEHWGLKGDLFRKPGEPVTPMVSWSDSMPATTYALLRVNVHAMHHQKGGLRYQSLRSHAYSPQMPPYGYSAMILLALVPPLFFKVMRPRLEKAKEVMRKLRESGDIEKVWTEDYLKENSFEKDFKKIGWF